MHLKISPHDFHEHIPLNGTQCPFHDAFLAAVCGFSRLPCSIGLVSGLIFMLLCGLILLTTILGGTARVLLSKKRGRWYRITGIQGFLIGSCIILFFLHSSWALLLPPVAFCRILHRQTSAIACMWTALGSVKLLKSVITDHDSKELDQLDLMIMKGLTLARFDWRTQHKQQANSLGASR